MNKTKYTVVATSKFKKDYRKMKTRKNFDEKAFTEVVEMLANDKILPEKFHNHLLEPKSERYLGMSYKTRLALNLCKK